MKKQLKLIKTYKTLKNIKYLRKYSREMLFRRRETQPALIPRTNRIPQSQVPIKGDRARRLAPPPPARSWLRKVTLRPDVRQVLDFGKRALSVLGRNGLRSVLETCLLQQGTSFNVCGVYVVKRAQVRQLRS